MPVAFGFHSLDEAAHLHPLAVLVAGDRLVKTDRLGGWRSHGTQVRKLVELDRRHVAAVEGDAHHGELFLERRRRHPLGIKMHPQSAGTVLQEEVVRVG